MMIPVSNREDIRWEDFFLGCAFEDISKGKNKVWFIMFEYDLNDRDSEINTLREIDASRRDDLLKADSYLEYYKKKKIKGKLPGNQDLRYIATKYDFVEKVVDQNNNLIIVVKEEQSEYDHPIECNEDDIT